MTTVARARRSPSIAVAGSIAAAVVMATGLAGCASGDPFQREVDPNSPLAARVEAVAAAPQAYPRWEEFPAAPTDLPPAADIAARVRTVETRGAELETAAAAIPWELSNDARWPAEARAAIDPRLARPAPPDAAARAAALRAELLARSTPPPVAQ